MDTVKLVIIGGGPGGYVAALRARQLGLLTTLIEAHELGGTCLNWGCIPTKALLKSAELLEKAHEMEAYGISAKEITFSLDAAIARSRSVVKTLSGGLTHLMKKNGVEVIRGRARIGALSKKGRIIEIAGATPLMAEHIVIATGASPVPIPGFVLDGDRVWGTKDALMPPRMPKSLLIVGAGATGVEFANIYTAFGARVTILELQDRILPQEDPEVSAVVQKALHARGIAFVLGKKASLSRKGEGFSLSTNDTVVWEGDHVLVAAGVRGNTDGLGLEHTAIKLERGQIVTDPWGETNDKGIWAIGDVARPPFLAHKASREGIVCVERIAGLNPLPADLSAIPSCIYGRPQVASLGLTEAAAKEQGYAVKVGTSSFSGNGQALALGESKYGFIKTVFDARTGELLGAHMVGPSVTEFLAGLSVARACEATDEDFLRAVFPHPTLSEVLQEAVLDADGKALHH